MPSASATSTKKIIQILNTKSIAPLPVLPIVLYASMYAFIAYMLQNLCGNNVIEGRGRGGTVQVFDPPLDWMIWSLAEDCQHPCQSDWASP